MNIGNILSHLSALASVRPENEDIILEQEKTIAAHLYQHMQTLIREREVCALTVTLEHDYAGHAFYQEVNSPAGPSISHSPDLTGTDLIHISYIL